MRRVLLQRGLQSTALLLDPAGLVLFGLLLAPVELVLSVLLAIGLYQSALALLGLIQGAREVMQLSQQPEWRAANLAPVLVSPLSGMIVPLAVDAFGIFLMRQYIRDLPDSLIEAARLDGCSEFGIFSRIIVPLISPALVKQSPTTLLPATKCPADTPSAATRTTP